MLINKFQEITQAYETIVEDIKKQDEEEEEMFDVEGWYKEKKTEFIHFWTKKSCNLSI